MHCCGLLAGPQNLRAAEGSGVQAGKPCRHLQACPFLAPSHSSSLGRCELSARIRSSLSSFRVPNKGKTHPKTSLQSIHPELSELCGRGHTLVCACGSPESPLRLRRHPDSTALLQPLLHRPAGAMNPIAADCSAEGVIRVWRNRSTRSQLLLDCLSLDNSLQLC